ncbi:transketolase [Candidatus Gottesmanbacteria bacterium]|nr:transketolase [Candidatus Gottesmanbacteria bacterium]
MNINTIQKLTKLIRYYILTMTTTAGSGHTTSSLSAVELMTALMFGGFFRTDLSNRQNPTNDRLIFSKGHASPLFYSLYAAAGKISMDELLQYRKFSSPLEGHPTLEFPYTEAPTGSLGQGLPIGLGMAMALRQLTGPAAHVSQRYDTSPVGTPRSRHPSIPIVYVLLGDGEMAEGSVWEAIQAASYNNVDNLVAVLDVNRLGQSQPTMFEHHLDEYKKRFEVFGWKTVIVKNGHDLSQVVTAYKAMQKLSGHGKPVAIIAKTFKGYGIKSLQDKDNWHGKPLPKDLYDQAIKELGNVDMKIRGEVKKPVLSSKYQVSSMKKNIPNKKYVIRNTIYKFGDSIATRQAAGDALTSLMYTYTNVVVLDGDVKNSLFTETTQREHRERYFEMFIAEQNMTGTAIGFSRRGFIPFMTTFSAFMTRAYDQIRMAALAKANIKFLGSHAGVSIGEDGASQMGLEDLSMFRSIWGSSVLYPADGVSTAKLMEEMIKKPGISYIRVARPTTSVIYDEKEEFPIGGSKLHTLSSRAKRGDPGVGSGIASPASRDRNDNKKVIIIAAGITLYEALKAQEELGKEGIEAIVVDCYSIKPIDKKTLIDLIKPSTTNYQPITNIITVEDHWFEGGLGDAVLNVYATEQKVKVYKLAVTKLPHSGKPAELLEYEGISTKGIVSKVKEILQ